jgi:hypothetical protein
MVAAHVPMEIRYKLFPKAFEYATDSNGLQVATVDELTTTRFKHFCGKNPKFAHHLRTWGGAGTVKTKTKTTLPIADRGVQCMFIGYAKDHEGDCYQMWNPKTEGVHTTRDVIWLRRMFYTAPTAVPELALEPDDDIFIITPQSQEADKNPNKSARESVDDVNLDDDDDELMPQLIPQVNDANDSDSSDKEDEDKKSEFEKGPVTGRTSSGRAVRAPIRYRDQEIGAMLAGIERMDINDAYVQAEIAGAAVNARTWEPVLSPAKSKYLKAMDCIDGTDFGDEDANAERGSEGDSKTPPS